MLGGEVDCIQGHVVMKLEGEWSRIDYAMLGWIGCLSRMIPDADLSAMDKLHKRITNRVPVTHNEITDALSLLNVLEGRMIKLSREQIKAAVLTEQIAIELDSMKLSPA
jgi:hypothetical protein